MNPGGPVRRWQPQRLAPDAAVLAARLSRRRASARCAGWSARVVAPPERVEGAEVHALTLAGAPAVLVSTGRAAPLRVSWVMKSSFPNLGSSAGDYASPPSIGEIERSYPCDR